MEKQYILNDAPSVEKNTRGTYQRNLDMLAFYYLANLYLAVGNPYNTESTEMIDFFKGKKDFPKTLHSKEIQESLRKIEKNWKMYKDSLAIKKITEFVQSTCVKNYYHDGNRPFDAILKYYANDKNHEYISVEKVFHDICETGKDNQICTELETFFKNLKQNAAEFDPSLKNFVNSQNEEDESE